MRPLFRTVADRAVAVDIVELAAQRLAVKGGVEGGATGDGRWVEGGGGDGAVGVYERLGR